MRRARPRLDRATLAPAVAAFLLAMLFALLVVLVRRRSDWVQSMDRSVSGHLHAFGTHHPGFVSAMRVVSDVGSPGVWWVPVLIAAFLLVRRNERRLALFAVVTLGGSWLVNHVVKASLNRARPQFPHAFATASGSSFPSGHAQAAAAACGILLVVGWPYLSRPARVPAVAGAVLVVLAVSFSRVALGVHFVSDVVGGVILAAAWLLVMIAVFGAWRREGGGTYEA